MDLLCHSRRFCCVSVVGVPVLLCCWRSRSSSFSASFVFVPPSCFFWPAVAFLSLWMMFLSWMAFCFVFFSAFWLVLPFFPLRILRFFTA